MAHTEKPQENGAENGVENAAETGDTFTRREALKLIAAASGALGLASIPAEWTKPELRFGVLPAYAQTSPTTTSLLTLNCSVTPGFFDAGSCETFTAQVSPAVAGVSIVLELYIGDPLALFASSTVTTDSSGAASAPFTLPSAGALEFRASFVDPTVGTGTCSETANVQ